MDNEFINAELLNSDFSQKDEITKSVLEIINVLDKLSNFEQRLILCIVRDLISHIPITEITRNPLEWQPYENNIYQNVRCESIFWDKSTDKYWMNSKYSFINNEGEYIFVDEELERMELNPPCLVPNDEIIYENTFEHKEYIKKYKIDPFANSAGI